MKFLTHHFYLILVLIATITTTTTTTADPITLAPTITTPPHLPLDIYLLLDKSGSIANYNANCAKKFSKPIPVSPCWSLISGFSQNLVVKLAQVCGGISQDGLRVSIQTFSCQNYHPLLRTLLNPSPNADILQVLEGFNVLDTFLPFGGTCPSSGLQTIYTSVSNTPATRAKVVIMITDGLIDPQDSARSIQSAIDTRNIGAMFFAVAIGHPTLAADRNTQQTQLERLTGDPTHIFRVEDEMSLDEITNTISAVTFNAFHIQLVNEDDASCPTTAQLILTGPSVDGDMFGPSYPTSLKCRYYDTTGTNILVETFATRPSIAGTLTCDVPSTAWPINFGSNTNSFVRHVTLGLVLVDNIMSSTSTSPPMERILTTTDTLIRPLSNTCIGYERVNQGDVCGTDVSVTLMLGAMTWAASANITIPTCRFHVATTTNSTISSNNASFIIPALVDPIQHTITCSLGSTTTSTTTPTLAMIDFDVVDIVGIATNIPCPSTFDALQCFQPAMIQPICYASPITITFDARVTQLAGAASVFCILRDSSSSPMLVPAVVFQSNSCMFNYRALQSSQNFIVQLVVTDGTTTRTLMEIPMSYTLDPTSTSCRTITLSNPSLCVGDEGSIVVQGPSIQSALIMGVALSCILSDPSASSSSNAAPITVVSSPIIDSNAIQCIAPSWQAIGGADMENDASVSLSLFQIVATTSATTTTTSVVIASQPSFDSTFRACINFAMTTTLPLCWGDPLIISVSGATFESIMATSSNQVKCQIRILIGQTIVSTTVVDVMNSTCMVNPAAAFVSGNGVNDGGEDLTAQATLMVTSSASSTVVVGHAQNVPLTLSSCLSPPSQQTIIIPWGTVQPVAIWNDNDVSFMNLVDKNAIMGLGNIWCRFQFNTNGSVLFPDVFVSTAEQGCLLPSTLSSSMDAAIPFTINVAVMASTTLTSPKIMVAGFQSFQMILTPPAFAWISTMTHQATSTNCVGDVLTAQVDLITQPTNTLQCVLVFDKINIIVPMQNNTCEIPLFDFDNTGLDLTITDGTVNVIPTQHLGPKTLCFSTTTNFPASNCLSSRGLQVEFQGITIQSIPATSSVMCAFIRSTVSPPPTYSPTVPSIIQNNGQVTTEQDSGVASPPQLPTNVSYDLVPATRLGSDVMICNSPVKTLWDELKVIYSSVVVVVESSSGDDGAATNNEIQADLRNDQGDVVGVPCISMKSTTPCLASTQSIMFMGETMDRLANETATVQCEFQSTTMTYRTPNSTMYTGWTCTAPGFPTDFTTVALLVGWPNAVAIYQTPVNTPLACFDALPQRECANDSVVDAVSDVPIPNGLSQSLLVDGNDEVSWRCGLPKFSTTLIQQDGIWVCKDVPISISGTLQALRRDGATGTVADFVVGNLPACTSSPTLGKNNSTASPSSSVANVTTTSSSSTEAKSTIIISVVCALLVLLLGLAVFIVIYRRTNHSVGPCKGKRLSDLGRSGGAAFDDDDVERQTDQELERIRRMFRDGSPLQHSDAAKELALAAAAFDVEEKMNVDGGLSGAEVKFAYSQTLLDWLSRPLFYVMSTARRQAASSDGDDDEEKDVNNKQPNPKPPSPIRTRALAVDSGFIQTVTTIDVQDCVKVSVAQGNHFITVTFLATAKLKTLGFTLGRTKDSRLVIESFATNRGSTGMLEKSRAVHAGYELVRVQEDDAILDGGVALVRTCERIRQLMGKGDDFSLTFRPLIAPTKRFLSADRSRYEVTISRFCHHGLEFALHAQIVTVESYTHNWVGPFRVAEVGDVLIAIDGIPVRSMQDVVKSFRNDAEAPTVRMRFESRRATNPIYGGSSSDQRQQKSSSPTKPKREISSSPLRPSSFNPIFMQEKSKVAMHVVAAGTHVGDGSSSRLSISRQFNQEQTDDFDML